MNNEEAQFQTNFNILKFIKFSDNYNFSKDLVLNGDVCFSLPNNFIKDSNPERGDRFEGAEIVDKTKQSFLKANIPGIGEKIMKFGPDSNSEIVQYNHKFLIYSLFALTQENLQNNDDYFIDKRMNEFGKYAVVINEPKLFLNSILDELKSQGISCKYGLVNYKDYNDNFNELTPFIKKIEHSHQVEFRIIIENLDNENKIISIGPVAKYGKLFSTEYLLKSKWKLV